MNHLQTTTAYRSEVAEMYSKIPDEMKVYPNWICWKSIPDENSHSGIKKQPINPFTGGNAMSNNSSTWVDYETAVRESVKYSGIGFMFGDSPFFGVDVDDAREQLEAYQNGETGNIIAEFISTLQSYTETSQSGNGIHIICRGTLPKSGRRKGKVEMYETGRFFIMTGNSCSEYEDIVDCTERIKALHEKYIGGGREPKPQRAIQTANLVSAGEIVTKAINSKNGEKFARLYRGDISGYTSQSDADMAFCNLLAFWTGCDADKMDEIFRRSGLMRDKWDREQSGSTYGKITIDKAIADCGEAYNPSKKGDFSVNFVGKSTAEAVKHKYYSFDDTGNAERLIDLFGGEIRYCYTDKRWLWFDGRRWLTDDTGAVRRLVDQSIDAMRDERAMYMDGDEDGEATKAFDKHFKASRSNKAKSALLSEAQHHVPIRPSETDKLKDKLNTPNGVVNLKDGTIEPHNASLYFTRITTTEYSNHADCPKWLEFLNDIFSGDEELIRYVQKAVGYSLSGSTTEQCAFFLYGTGRNGKSTFLNQIRDIFGDYAANIQPETIMVKSNSTGTINSDIARLKGARLVTSVEPNEGVRLNEGLLKQLTGDDTVTARKLYGDEFEFKPEFKLWMATNHKPTISGTDEGIWRRIRLIPFTVQIPEEKVDKNLKYKLAAEATGILKWAVEGCLLWQREGLEMPKAVKGEVKEYRKEMDVLSSFIEDRCTVREDLRVQSSRIFQAYIEWARENNEFEYKQTKFSIEMKKRFGFERTATARFLTGIALKEDMNV